MSTADEIYDLMETTGKNAPDIAQALKSIGGDMQTGIKKIANYFQSEGMIEGYRIGKQVGEKSGFIKGSAVMLTITTLVGAGAYLYDRHKKKAAIKAHEAEGEEILDAIKETILTGENVSIDTTHVGTEDSSLGEKEAEK